MEKLSVNQILSAIDITIMRELYSFIKGIFGSVQHCVRMAKTHYMYIN